MYVNKLERHTDIQVRLIFESLLQKLEKQWIKVLIYSNRVKIIRLKKKIKTIDEKKKAFELILKFLKEQGKKNTKEISLQEFQWRLTQDFTP